MCVGYTLLQLFCIYSLCYMYCNFARELYFVLFHQRFPQDMCRAQYGCFFCGSLVSCFPGMLLRYVSVTLKWFQSPLLLLVSLCFYIQHALYFYCRYSWLLSVS